MGQEQRRDPRITSRQRLWCEGQEEPGAAETRDVSHSGMFIVAEHAPEVGVRIVGFDKGREAYERFVNRHMKDSGAPAAPKSGTSVS